MKRRFIIPLTSFFVLILLLNVSLADVEQEITFNGIPWGTSITNVNQKLVELGYSNDKPDETSLHTWPYHWQSDYKHTVKDTGLSLNTSYWSDDTHKIAGYVVGWTTMLAYYDYDDEKVNIDEDKSHFCQAIIQFSIEYELVDKAFEDLKSKLTTLYGSSVQAIVDDEAKAFEWYGTNNTAVRLEQRNGKDYKYIYLIYGITNIDSILNEVREAVVKSIPDADPNDFSGL